jgi:hypothetical protein
LKPFEEDEEETVIAQPPPPVPQQVPDNEQQQPPEEHDLEGEEEEDLPDVDLGPEEEEGEQRSRPRHFGNHEGALGGSERHAVAGTRNAVARQRDVIAAVGGDDDTSSNQSGRGGNETRSRSKDNEATGTLGTTAATGSQEHRAGATRTTRTAATG